MAMNRLIGATFLASTFLTLCTGSAGAQEKEWRRYVIAETGANVDLPTGLFSNNAGKPDTGYGGRFLTADGRAKLTVRSLRNDRKESPAAFLARMRPPRDIVYRRVTRNFFVVSSVRNGSIWYDRCNFAGRGVTCVLINYPVGEKKAWDGVVTRISNSLSSG
jgi:hypothetical protein